MYFVTDQLQSIIIMMMIIIIIMNFVPSYGWMTADMSHCYSARRYQFVTNLKGKLATSNLVITSTSMGPSNH